MISMVDAFNGVPSGEIRGELDEHCMKRSRDLTLDGKILEVIYEVVDQMNAVSPADRQIPKQPEAALYGEKAVLDSLGLVNFVVTTETRLRRNLALQISLTDDRALSQKRSPFRTIESLVEYISALAEEAKSA